MKELKVVLVVVIVLTMFDVMMVKAEAGTATEDGYAYSTDGKNTSNVLFSGEDIIKYEVIEKDIKTGNKEYNKMEDYLVGYNTQYTIPGLVNTNVVGHNCNTMIPQGICRMDNYVLVTAYDYEGKYNSVIYVINTSGQVQATLVYNKKCHMGGIAYDGKSVWIAEGGEGKSKNGVGVINKSIILEAIKKLKEKNAKSIRLKDIKWLQAKELESTSFCTYFDNKLWFGTFDKDGTNDIYGYVVNYSGSSPVLSAWRYIEAPKKAQGITFYKDLTGVYFGVATSYGRRNNSIIRCYKLENYYSPKVKYNGVLKIVCDEYRRITMPPMLEQISVHGVFMYGIFESGAKPYVDGSDGKNKAARVVTNYCIFAAESIFK